MPIVPKMAMPAVKILMTRLTIYQIPPVPPESHSIRVVSTPLHSIADALCVRVNNERPRMAISERKMLFMRLRFVIFIVLNHKLIVLL